MAATLARVFPAVGAGRRAPRLLERNVMVYRRQWLVLATGVLEPVFYLFSIGVGLGTLVGPVAGTDYSAYVAPALLASSAMNGAVFDSTFNVFYKLRFAKIYDAILATPVGVADVAVGEVGWALLRGALYAAAFLVVMAADGAVRSAWAALALPAATLVGFAFAAVGMAATTFMRSWQDFDFVTLATLPLFLFSATFYPLSTYPDLLQVVVQLTPLYHGVDLLRGLCLGRLHPGMLVDVAYLAVMGAVGVAVAARRLGRLLLR